MKITNPVIVHEWRAKGGLAYALAVADVEEARVEMASVFSFWAMAEDEPKPGPAKKERHRAVLLQRSADVLGNATWHIANVDGDVFRDVLQQLASLVVSRSVKGLLADRMGAS